MLTSLKRVLALSVVCTSPALAQARPATQPSTSSSAAATTDGQFVVGPFYAGPRVWLGNLNGAMAIGGQIEKGFTEPGKYGPGIIGGGLGIDYYSWDWDYLGNAGYSYSVIPIQIFSNYHFVIDSNKKLDPYAGLAFVYSIVNASWKGSGTSVEADGNYSDIAGQAGVRYFVTPKLAVQGQIGFGYGTLGIGATWKF
jgi:hypothetical protein